MNAPRQFAGVVLPLVALSVTPTFAAEPAGLVIKSESFDADPNWDAHNNHVTPEKIPTVTQAFGYSATHFAGKEKGEMGGRVTRSTRPAYYAQPIEAPKTLDDKLTASGSFAITASTGGSGVFFGWFNSSQPGGGGRPMNSLGLDFDGEGKGARLAIRMISGTNKSCGTFVTPFVPGNFRPTPIRNDGTRYHWTLAYDPQAAAGKGQFTFTIKSDGDKPEDFEGKPFTVDLPDGFRKEGATFDRFGLMNMMKSGGDMTIYFDDLRQDGVAEDFARDPAWAESGNRDTYADREQVGAHDFGYSPTTNFAGGAKPGEIGGSFWRSGKYAYYADRVGTLTLNDRLTASGKVILKVGAPDSDMYLGYFAGGAKDKPPAESAHFLGIHVGGPTRVGHYFLPSLATTKGSMYREKAGPILTPNKALDWTLDYDPAANDNQGRIRVTLGHETATLDLKAGVKTEGATFDRFGLFTSTAGGQLLKVYVDDLKYTVRKAP